MLLCEFAMVDRRMPRLWCWGGEVEVGYRPCEKWDRFRCFKDTLCCDTHILIPTSNEDTKDRIAVRWFGKALRLLAVYVVIGFGGEEFTTRVIVSKFKESKQKSKFSRKYFTPRRF